MARRIRRNAPVKAIVFCCYEKKGYEPIYGNIEIGINEVPTDIGDEIRFTAIARSTFKRQNDIHPCAKVQANMIAYDNGKKQLIDPVHGYEDKS